MLKKKSKRLQQMGEFRRKLLNPEQLISQTPKNRSMGGFRLRQFERLARQGRAAAAQRLVRHRAGGGQRLGRGQPALGSPAAEAAASAASGTPRTRPAPGDDPPKRETPQRHQKEACKPPATSKEGTVAVPDMSYWLLQETPKNLICWSPFAIC